MPDGRINKISLFSYGISFREAPLTLTTLAALVPDELNAEIRLVDRSVGTPVPFGESFDLVGISLMTGTSTEGYEIADAFRAGRVPVVLGGVHVTLCPDEAASHADAIVTGFAEESWPALLLDFARGSMKPRYNEAPGNQRLSGLPRPRRELQRSFAYMLPNTVMATRGCRGACEFCSVPAARFGWRTRPVGEVIDEIRAIRSRRIAINDVNLTDEREYAMELFSAMIPLKKKWGALASTRIAADPELLALMQQAGCSFLLLGFESCNALSLARINKSFNKADNYASVVDTLHRFGITVQGCFIFGFDEDEPDIFTRTLEQVNALKIDIPRYALYTPYPGTRAYSRMEEEGRLLHREWGYYDTQHVVIRPQRMSPVELDRGLRWAYEETFRLLPALRRARSSGGPGYVTFLGNLAYKLYIKRLRKDRNRFPGYLSDALLHTTAGSPP